MRCRNTVTALMCITMLLGSEPALEAEPSRPAPVPELLFDAPEHLRPVVERLRQADPRPLRAAMDFIGVQGADPPIRVILAPEDSRLARRVPGWILGYADGDAGIIVLLPERVPSYPYGALESVLTHEVAHVLLARASAGRPVPRWFDEGVAMIVADRWGLEDRARLVWAMVSGRSISLARLDAEFRKDQASAQGAYVLAKAFLRYMLRQWGPEVPRRLLALVAQGRSFPEAFAQVTGVPLHAAESAFWSQQTVWSRWVPIITSSATLWMGVTLLTFYAYRRRRQHAAKIRQEWAEDGDAD